MAQLDNPEAKDGAAAAVLGKGPPPVVVTHGVHGSTWRSEDLSEKQHDFGECTAGVGFGHNLDPGRASRKTDADIKTEYDAWKTQWSDDMIALGVNRMKKYAAGLNSKDCPSFWPSHLKEKWPPRWCQDTKKLSSTITSAWFEKHLLVLVGLGVTKNRDCNLEHMFSDDSLHQVPWIRKLTTYSQMRLFLSALHFEACGDGKPDRGDTNVPKVGKLLELFRRNCESFFPEANLDIDEATAKYGGRMTRLKHLQSKYKPYDGIRIYCVNGSRTSYLYTFRVDLRDGTSVHDMTKSLFEKLKEMGISLWADNAFVTVDLLKWCAANGIKFAGTTRTTWGFPAVLIDETLEQGDWKWMMDDDGNFAVYVADVGFVKMMSNHHSPTATGLLERREADRAEKKKIEEMIELLMDYNINMGGTDMFDFERGVFSTQRRSKKWWHTLFYFVLDSSLNNGCEVWRFVEAKRNSDFNRAKHRRKAFLEAVFYQGLEKLGFRLKGEKRAAGGASPDHVAKRVKLGSLDCSFGGCVVTPDDMIRLQRKSHCQYCYQTVKEADGKKRVSEARYKCKGCSVALHVKCATAWHVDSAQGSS